MYTLNSSPHYGDDVRTLGTGPRYSKKARVVRWNIHSDNQGTTDIEDEDTPEDTTNGLDDGATRAVGFRGSATLERVSQRSNILWITGRQKSSHCDLGYDSVIGREQKVALTEDSQFRYQRNQRRPEQSKT